MYLTLYLFSIAVVQTLTEHCVTPNNEPAECVSLYSCSVLIDALAKHEGSAIEFVRRSHCGNGSDPMVCCGSTSEIRDHNNHSLTVTITEDVPAKSFTRLSDRRYCGYQHSDDYFHEEGTAALDEFPWIAVLLYEHIKNKDYGKLLLCGGAVISPRYILTAANCIPAARNPFRLVAVRVGEYNVKNDEDCVDDRDTEAADCPQEYGIEKTIRHPNFESDGNDIGLIRLNHTLWYSDYIRPICLPVPGKAASKPGDSLIIGSFGYYGVYTVGAIVKEGEFITLITHEECSSLYNTTIAENQICTKHNNTDPYFYRHHDKGYPLMFRSRYNQWQIEGIWSWSKGCKSSGPYSKNTRVASHLKWIQETVKP